MNHGMAVCVRFFGALLLAAGLAGAVRAGPVETTVLAGNNGQGLRVHVAPDACQAGANERVINGQTYTESGEENVCERLSARDSVIKSPAVVSFSAGYRVGLGTGFRVEQGAEFAVSVAPSRVRGGFVRDDSPSAEPHYAVRYSMNADNLTLDTGERLVLLEAEDHLGRPWLSLVMRYDSPTNSKRLSVTTPDGAASADSAEFEVMNGWQAIELEWRASESGKANGRIWVTRNGVAQPDLTGLDNEDGRIDSVRWGVLNALDTTDGHLDLDDFVSRRAGPIGPP